MHALEGALVVLPLLSRQSRVALALALQVRRLHRHALGVFQHVAIGCFHQAFVVLVLDEVLEVLAILREECIYFLDLLDVAFDMFEVDVLELAILVQTSAVEHIPQDQGGD